MDPSWWEEFAEPMWQQALNDFRLAGKFKEMIEEYPKAACTGVALLAQATEKTIKAWLLSQKVRGITWALDWKNHDVFSEMESGGSVGRLRDSLRGRLGSSWQELKQLLNLLPKGRFTKNVEYPYREGTRATAPCEGITDFEFHRFMQAVKLLFDALEPEMN